MSEILKEIGPTVVAETVQMVSKIVKDTQTDVRKEDIKSVASMAEKLSEDLKHSEPEDIKVVTNMLKKVGPNLSTGEQKMITKIAKESTFKTAPSKRCFLMIFHLSKNEFL